MQYFGGKARISKTVSQYINLIMGGLCDTSVEKQRLPDTLVNTSTHTHTHTLRRTFLWSV